MTKREAVFTKDPENKKLTIIRVFEAPLESVWNAWTQSEILDQWWAPKPYLAETKTIDFREGGHWLYLMKGPDNSGHDSWCIENIKTIQPLYKITNDVSFCDEEGNINHDFPTMHWKKEFNQQGEETVVKVEITFDMVEDLETIVKMGFQQGFIAGLDNLDEYLSA